MSYLSTVLADSPVSYWRLGEASATTATDVQGVNNGSYQNSSGISFAQTGATVDADTSVLLVTAGNGYVLLKSGTILATLTNASMEIWVKITSVPSQYPAIYAERAASGNDVWRLLLMASGEAGNVAGRLAFQHTDDAGTADTFICTGGTVVANNAWHHVVVTKSGTTLRIYVDGTLEAGSPFTITGNDTMTNSGLETRVGADAADPTVFLASLVDAYVDEVAVYNTALSAPTVAAHYNAGLGITAAVPTLYVTQSNLRLG